MRKKKGARYPDIVLLTFTVGICNAYKLENTSNRIVLDPHNTSHTCISTSECGGESSDRDIPVIEASAWFLDPSPVTENFLLRFATA